MWADNETSKDLLGFKIHADLIRSVITNSNLLPITMGVFGDWGSGKTSIMKMLEHDLNYNNHKKDTLEHQKYEDIVVLYFNGWLFEGYDDAKSALISSILLQLSEHKRFGPKVKAKVKNLLNAVDWMRITKMGLSEIAIPAIGAYFTGGTSLIPGVLNYGKKIIDKVTSTSEDEEAADINQFVKDSSIEEKITDIRTFREEFENLLKETNISSLIVLIDDLDRCSNERIIENLEAIKLFLNVERTAFIIGADPRIVRHAIEVKYANMKFNDEKDSVEASDRLVTDYLEKLIQIPYRLPKLSPSEVETYMTLLFCSRDIQDEQLLDKVFQACEDQRCINRYSIFGYGAIKDIFEDTEIPPSLKESLTFSSNISSLITEGLKGNPRQIKRFLNALFLRKELAKIAGLKNIKDDILVKLMLLEYGHPQQFLDLFDWQSTQEGRPEEIKNIETILNQSEDSELHEEEIKKIDPQWSSSFMRRWILIDPILSDTDLRDYFWIARDKLSSTLSGVSMIPPVIRNLLEDILSDNNAKRIQAIKSSISLNNDDLIVLIDLIVKHIKRNPSIKIGYDALRALIEKDNLESIKQLNNVLNSVPTDSIPPAVGNDLLILIRNKVELEEKFRSTIDFLKSTDSMISRTLITNN